MTFRPVEDLYQSAAEREAQCQDHAASAALLRDVLGQMDGKPANQRLSATRKRVQRTTRDESRLQFWYRTRFGRAWETGVKVAAGATWGEALLAGLVVGCVLAVAVWFAGGVVR